MMAVAAVMVNQTLQARAGERPLMRLSLPVVEQTQTTIRIARTGRGDMSLTVSPAVCLAFQGWFLSAHTIASLRLRVVAIVTCLAGCELFRGFIANDSHYACNIR